MQHFNLIEFLARYTSNPEEHEFFKTVGHLPPLSPQGPWLAGGAVRRLLAGDKLDSDFDLFFRDSEQLQAAVNHIEASGGKLEHSNDHQQTWLLPVGNKTIKVQCIKIGFYADLPAVLDSFDFTITMTGYDGASLVVGDHTLWDLARRRLALHRLTYGVSTLRRLIKYSRHGYTACGGVMASILERVADDPALIRHDTQYVD